MIYPTIHLNGTSRKELKEQAYAAHRALEAALEALRAMAPHGRDYYPQGNEAYQTAREEWEERLRQLEQIQADVMSYFMNLRCNQEDNR